MTIRNARPEDAYGIERLYRQLTADDPNVRVLLARIDKITADPATQLLAAERSGRLVGTTLLTVCLDVMYGEQPYLVVENVVVDHEARGAGVGRRLLTEVDRLALETNATKVMLLSASSRPAAHRFFEACGYSSTAKRAFVRSRSDIA